MKPNSKGTWLLRLGAFCLSLVLILALAAPAWAEEAKATDLRLERTEGTVTAQNANGRTVSIREGMKLYSGYTVTTQAASYAYITLDDNKVVKLDGASEAEIRKQGDKLEVLVKSGQLFFNVASPVASGKSLNVRTSTMVTGIRGTSGYVRVVDDTRSSVTVLDGQVEVTTPDTGEYQSFETVTIAAGITGIAMDHEADEHWQVLFEGLVTEEIPGFVLTELAGDAQLCQRIAEDTQLPVEELAAIAQERLQADQQAQQEAQAALDEAAEELNAGGSSSAPPFQYEEPVVQPKEEEPAGGGGGAAPAEPAPTTPTTPTAPTTPSTPTTGSITLKKVLVSDAGNAVYADTQKSYTFEITGPANSTQTVTLPAGTSEDSQTVVSGLPLGTYTVTEQAPAGDAITSLGTTYNYAYNSGAAAVTIDENNLNPTATITNTYVDPANATGSITLTKKLVDGSGAALKAVGSKTYSFSIAAASGGTQTASVTVADGASEGTATVSGLAQDTYTVTETEPTGDAFTSGVVTYTYASNSVSEPVVIAVGSLNQSVTITNTYTKPDSYTITGAVTGTQLQQYLDAYTTVNIGSGGSAGIVNGEDITVPSGNTLNVESGGTISIDGTSLLTNKGTMTNSGTIDNAYVLYNSGQFTNNGTITNTGTKTGWTFTNAATFDNNSTINNQGQLENYHTFNNAGTITNSGMFLNTTGGNASGTVNNTKEFNNTGTLTNMDGCTFNNNTGGTITNGKTINVYGTLVNNAAITNNSGATIKVSTSVGTNAEALLTNNGTITNNGSIEKSGGGKVEGSGTITGNAVS